MPATAMPTSAKFFAALWFAGVGWLAANAHVPALGDGIPTGYFREICAVIGLFCGWLVMGRLVSSGWVEAVNGGIRTAVTLVFFALLGFSVYQMVLKSMQRQYDGPMDAVLGAFLIMWEHAQTLLSPGVLLVLGLGALFGGIFSEWVHRTWR